MMVRVIVYLAVLIMLTAGGSQIHFMSIKSSISDNDLKAQSAILDKGIVNWYRNHSALPNNLSESVLSEMGVSSLDASKFTYVKSSATTYTLTVTTSKGAWVSPYSNKALPAVKN